MNQNHLDQYHPASRITETNSGIISPLLAAALPPDFDFIASMSSGQKIYQIKPIRGSC